MPKSQRQRPKTKAAGKGGQIIEKQYKNGKIVFIVKYASAHIGTAHSREEAEQWVAREMEKDPWRKAVS